MGVKKRIYIHVWSYTASIISIVPKLVRILSLLLVIRSKYCRASRGRRPSRKKFSKWEWVCFIKSNSCSNILSCCSLLSSTASSQGSRFFSSSKKWCLQCSCPHPKNVKGKKKRVRKKKSAYDEQEILECNKENTCEVWSRYKWISWS